MTVIQTNSSPVLKVVNPITQVVKVAALGPQGPMGNAGFISLLGNTPVPVGTPAGTVILRY